MDEPPNHCLLWKVAGEASPLLGISSEPSPRPVDIQVGLPLSEPKMNIRTIYLAIRVVKNTLSDTRSKVRMAILRIIGQLALSGFQDRIKGWSLKYVSVQLTLPTYKLTDRRDNFYQRDLEEKMVHKVTMDTVRIITSSFSGMTNEFWVRLLCYIMETDYTEALTPICVSLTNLAQRQLHTKDEEASASRSRHGLSVPGLGLHPGHGPGGRQGGSVAPGAAVQDGLQQRLRPGVILCFGLCARGQVKTVLGVLHDFEERIQESEQSWQIGTWRKDHPWRRETVKGALMVMYSCVASYCHPQMLLIHVDNPTKIIHHYSSSCQSQDICLKMAFLKSVVQVTDAIKNIKDLEDFQFAQKATLTGLIMAIIKAEPTDSLVSPVRIMAMDALLYLSKLKPFYSTEESSELMDISIHSVISLQPPGESNESIKTLYASALRALEQLMEGLMQRHRDPKRLQEMVHVSCLEEGQEPVVASPPECRSEGQTLSGKQACMRVDLGNFFRQSFKLAEKSQEQYKELLYAFHPDP